MGQAAAMNESTAAVILAQRQRLKLGQAEYGRLYGVAPATVCRWERAQKAPNRRRWASIIDRDRRDGVADERGVLPFSLVVTIGNTVTTIPYTPGDEVRFKLIPTGKPPCAT